jgi:hypothetical protein
MKIIPSFAALSIFLMFVMVAQSPAATPFNLIAGVGPVNSEGSWIGYSAISVISGPALFSKTSPTTTFYIGFTAGTTAVVSNMVLYKTATRGSKITSVTPVTLGGVSNPTIKVSETSVCPSQPISVTSPCLVRLDPVKLTLSDKDDYYLVIYFTTGSDISSTHGAFPTTGLTGWYIGADETQLKVGQVVPSGDGGTPPYFLIAVMSD